MMKRVIFTWLIWLCSLISIPVFAQQEDPAFELIPEATKDDIGQDVKELGEVKSSKNFSEIYNKKARDLWSDWTWDLKEDCAWLGNQFASGIMNWDTILCLATQIVRFVSNMAMVVWALMIIYAWYIYAMSVFNSDAFGVSKGHAAIKRATIWIVIVILSYAMINFVIEAFL